MSKNLSNENENQKSEKTSRAAKDTMMRRFSEKDLSGIVLPMIGCAVLLAGLISCEFFGGANYLFSETSKKPQQMTSKSALTGKTYCQDDLQQDMQSLCIVFDEETLDIGREAGDSHRSVYKTDEKGVYTQRSGEWSLVYHFSGDNLLTRNGKSFSLR